MGWITLRLAMATLLQPLHPDRCSSVSAILGVVQKAPRACALQAATIPALVVQIACQAVSWPMDVIGYIPLDAMIIILITGPFQNSIQSKPQDKAICISLLPRSADGGCAAARTRRGQGTICTRHNNISHSIVIMQGKNIRQELQQRQLL